MQRALVPSQHASPDARSPLARIGGRAVGLDLTLPVAGGGTRRRVYLDSTASTLRLEVVEAVLERYGPYYANTHSTVHNAARVSTAAYDWAHQKVLAFTHADPARYAAFFVGSGTTGGMNRIARTLARRMTGRDVVITSMMEHHSNDLPHRKHFATVVHVPMEVGETSFGSVDLTALEAALEAHRGRVAYVAVTGVSNVTGIVNPVHDIAALAHRHDTLIVVDAAQMIAHMPVHMGGPTPADRDLDVLVFSGHKIYAPGSPGVVVARRDLLMSQEPEEVGGGMVDDVHLDRYVPTERLPDREEAGTPNIPGAIGLAAALEALDTIGMDVVHDAECELMAYALGRLSAIPEVAIYGDRDTTRYPRTGAISFNIAGMHHALTAAILNDYFNIAVRNACFCAHPYVREMVTEALSKADLDMDGAELEAMAELERGMVRASFGVYTTHQDVDTLVAALTDLVARREALSAEYEPDGGDGFRHRTFRIDPRREFDIAASVADWVAASGR